MITIKDRNTKRCLEIERVKSLKTGGSQWVVDTRLEGDLYMNDPVTKLKGCGPATSRKFEAHGIKSLGNLCALDNTGIQAIVSGLTELSLTMRQVCRFKELATNAKNEDAPGVRDYRKEDNPYAARFGENEWEDRDRKVV
jgi:hypothetical protein